MNNSISEITQLWDKALIKIESRLDEKRIFDSFFSDSYINEISGNTIVVVVNSAFAVAMMQSKYKDIIDQSVEEVADQIYNLY